VAGGRRAADEAAAYCDNVLRQVAGFEESLIHMSLALGRNVSLVELAWEATTSGLRLAGLVPVDFGRLVLGELDELRLLTEEEPYEGIGLPAHKFIVHMPQAVSGHPSRGGLLRVTALAYLAKHFALKDWLIFAEVFGMPVRIARYSPNATREEKRELLEMLKQLGADATGIFSKAVEIEIQHTRMPGETNLYENLCLYCDREISKAWIGQTLTTDTVRTLASAGAAVVHDRVRRDIRDDDLRKEAHTLRRDLLTPLVRFGLGPQAPVPYFRRVLDQTLDPEQLSRVLDVAVNNLGARVPARWAHAALGLPQADPEAVVLPGMGGGRKRERGARVTGDGQASGRKTEDTMTTDVTRGDEEFDRSGPQDGARTGLDQVVMEASVLGEAWVPHRVQIAPWGEVRSSTGSFIVDEDAAKEAIAGFIAHGTDLPVDYEHQTLGGAYSSPSGQAPAAGWIKALSAVSPADAERDGSGLEPGLWAETEWTAEGLEKLRAKQYRYLSPVVLVRRKDRRLVGIHSVALTNKPAIVGMRPVVNKSPAAAPRLEVGPSLSTDLRGLLAVEDSASDEVVLVAAAERIRSLEQAEKLQQATQQVSRAMSAGKLTVAQHDWALSLAQRDPLAFDEWAASAPVVVPLGRLSPPSDGTGGGSADRRAVEETARAEWRANREFLETLCTESSYVANALREPVA
jgi:phage I-like protein